MIDEFTIVLDDKLVKCPAFPEPCDYLRITTLEGEEIVYWHYNEWQEEPRVCMGAILAAIGNPIDELVSGLRGFQRGEDR